MARNYGSSKEVWIIALLVIAVLVVAYFGFFAKPRGDIEVKTDGVTGDFAEPGGYVEGFWNETTQRCTSGRTGMILGKCCLNRQPDGTFKQVSCGTLTTAQSFFINNEATARNDTSCDAYFIDIKNTGTTVIDEAWVSNVAITAKNVSNNLAFTVPTALSNSWNAFANKAHVAVPVGGTVPYYGQGASEVVCYNDWAVTSKIQYMVTVYATYKSLGQTLSSQGGVTFTVQKAAASMEMMVHT
jgi:hypothetical protein